MTELFSFIDPKAIVTNREKRQRQENISDVEDLKQSIKAIGIINPIVINQVNGHIVLVAGERRLKAALELDLPTVPIRLFSELTPDEAEVIELEENIKRKELAWRDQVRAIGRIHILYRKQHIGWKIEQTAESISIHPTYLRKILHVFDALDTGRISHAENIDQAYNTLHRFGERKAEAIVAEIMAKGSAIFGPSEAPTALTMPVTDVLTTTSAIAVADEEPAKLVSVGWNETTQTASIMVSKKVETIVPPDPIICANFIEWIKTYNGPKFSLIHCDFPYGNYKGGDSLGSLAGTEVEDFYDNNEGVYWTLLEALTNNLDKIMSYSAHLMFWFNMNFYIRTVAELRKTGLMVHDHPLVWHKTPGGGGGLGVVPGTAVTYPRRTYDTALLAVRGNRPLAKPGMNSYACHTVGNKIHPSQKPDSMLRFFLSMLVDETTTMFDPTCGSGAALRAAEDLGAKSILGLELDPNYASTANAKTLQARILRQAGTFRKEEGLL